jgi:hypothetical protein
MGSATRSKFIDSEARDPETGEVLPLEALYAARGVIAKAMGAILAKWAREEEKLGGLHDRQQVAALRWLLSETERKLRAEAEELDRRTPGAILGRAQE